MQYNTITGTLHANQESYKIFNSTIDEMADFISMNSPWCLIYVVATNAKENKESHILSSHRRESQLSN